MSGPIETVKVDLFEVVPAVVAHRVRVGDSRLEVNNPGHYRVDLTDVVVAVLSHALGKDLKPGDPELKELWTPGFWDCTRRDNQLILRVEAL